jgi:hypothetical protein
VVNDVIVRPFRRDGHASDHLAKPCLHVLYDDRAMPINVGRRFELIEQRVTQEIMRIENEYRLAPEIGDDHPFLARGVDLPEERIVRGSIELRQDAPVVGLREADDALCIYWLTLVSYKNVVQVEKVAPVASTGPTSPPLVALRAISERMSRSRR